MSVVIKMKGLPFESTSKDIKTFFQGLYLREDEIHLAAYKDGKASGIAFAVFHSDEDARKAMFRNGRYMGKRYIELFLSSATEMNSMLQHGVPEPRYPRVKEGSHDQTKTKRDPMQNRDQKVSRNDRREPRPRARSRSPLSRRDNLRFESDFMSSRVRERNRGSSFSSSGDVNERSFGSDNRGGAFEMRWSEEDSDRQDRYHRLQNEREFSRERMGDRTEQMDDRGMHYRMRGHEKEDGAGSGHRRSPYSARGERDREDWNEEICCRIFGLPFQVTEAEIINFFKGYSVIKVKLLHHPGGSFAGRKNGHGYVEFRSVREAKEAAKKKHKQYLGSRYLEVVNCTKKEMVKESNLNDEACQRAEDGHRGNRESRYDSHEGKPISDLAIKIDPEILNPTCTYGIPGLLDNAPDLTNLGLSLPNPFMSSESLGLQTLATLNQLASNANINPEDVTAGCVVGIRNLPSTITAEEILDFFYGFPVFQDSVRIHYLAPGRSSGDAMVTFRSGREAAAAIEQLNHKPVGKRNVQLFLV